MQFRANKFRSQLVMAALGTSVLLLSACGGSDAGGDDVAALDEKLVGQGSDPAMTGALHPALDDRLCG